MASTMGIAQTDEEIQDEVRYFYALDQFAGVIRTLNKEAFDGIPKAAIEKNICRLIPAFAMLCGMTATGEIDIMRVIPTGKIGRKKKAEPPKQEQSKPQPRTMLQSTLKARDGWGMCPKCGKKCIKVNDNTILVNYPMFCKVCRRDYIVTWRLEGECMNGSKL